MSLNLSNFFTIFISIVLEALPFIILGSFLSALIQIFISEETIAKIVPKNKVLGCVVAAMTGLIFPVCECAIVPIARRLIKKGVPLGIATTFMISVPIVNPVVLLSTYYAFNYNINMVIIRGMGGFLGAVTVGILIEAFTLSGNVIKNNNVYTHDYDCSCGCNTSYDNSKFAQILSHASRELYDIGKLLILGAGISAAFQIFIPRNFINTFGQDRIISVLIMMLFAFVISLCSEADAFIAASFTNMFSLGAISSFLILGPMIDIKNTLMLSYSFKKSYIIKLLIFVFILCFIIGEIVNVLNGLGMIT